MMYNRKLLIEAIRHDHKVTTEKFKENAAEFERERDELIEKAVHYTHGEFLDGLKEIALKAVEDTNYYVTAEELQKIFLSEKGPWARYKAPSQDHLDSLTRKAEKERARIRTGESSAVIFLESLTEEKISDSGLEKAGFPGMRPGKLIAKYLEAKG